MNENGKSKLRNRNSIKNMVIQELKRPFQIKTEKKKKKNGTVANTALQEKLKEVLQSREMTFSEDSHI